MRAPWPLLFFVVAGSMLCALGVALGAFGAHVFEQMFTEPEIWTFRTGVEYQFIHGIGMILCGLLGKRLNEARGCVAAGWLFLAGIVLFCFSLYGIVLFKASFLGAVAPIGGVCFMAGWVILAWTAFRGWRDEG